MSKVDFVMMYVAQRNIGDISMLEGMATHAEKVYDILLAREESKETPKTVKRTRRKKT